MSEGWRRTTTVGQLRKELEGASDEMRVVIRMVDQATMASAHNDVRAVEIGTTEDTGEDQPDGGDVPILIITTEASLGDDDEEGDDEEDPS